MTDKISISQQTMWFVSLVMTVLISISGSYVTTQKNMERGKVEREAMRQQLEVMRIDLQKKADNETVMRDIQEVKEGIGRIEEIMMILGGRELKKKLNDDNT